MSPRSVARNALVACPKCCEAGEVLDVEATQTMRRCSLCVGTRKVPQRYADIWTRELEDVESEDPDAERTT